MTNQTFEQLKKTYESGRTRPLAWRRAQLNALRRLVTENRDAFVSPRLWLTWASPRLKPCSWN